MASAVYIDTLRARGQLIGATTLKDGDCTMHIYIRHGRPVADCGALAAARFRLLGHYMIEARDLNEALRIASDMPLVQLGGAEVRWGRECLGTP